LKALALHPLFVLGTLLRLLLVMLVVPAAVTQWYVPFLELTTSMLTVNPWGSWLAASGDPAAFPYGYAMWLAFLPLAAVCQWTGVPLLVGYMATLFVADLALLLMLLRLFPLKRTLVLAVYWLSPIVIFASYGLGFNDLLPIVLLVGSLYLVRERRLEAAGFLCIAAVSGKLSMVIALPFFVIYFLNNRAVRQLWTRFVFGAAVGALIFAVPFLLSRAGMFMLFGNPEMDKVYRLAIELAPEVRIYLLPLLYLVLLYSVWRVRRLNYELLQATLGVAFLGVVLMTHAAPGWFIWAIPFLVFYQASSDRMAVALTAVFSAFYVLSAALVHPLVLPGMTLALSAWVDARAVSLLQTALVATGIVLAVRMWRETVSRNDYFRLSRSPFVMGVAGDSGSGKDTFCRAVAGLFGWHSVVMLSGDNYHLWDRQKPMWQVMTHLNPMANDIEAFSSDLVALADGKTITAKEYDHESGRMSSARRVPSNDFIIANGLHALYLPILRACYHLRVYLDIDEGLRRYFKFRQDVGERGHTAGEVAEAFAAREPDSDRFIRPQAEHADLIFSLQPIHPAMIQDPVAAEAPRFKLVVRTRQELNERSLQRVLVGVCGLHVDLNVIEDDGMVEITMEGDVDAEDVAMAAAMLCPRLIDFLDVAPGWESGVLGLMQLITLSHINQALTRRFI
jgi:uridine kinase